MEGGVRTPCQPVRLGQKETAMNGKNRINDLWPKTDGTYVEFGTAEGEVLAISIPRTEAAVVRHFPGTYALWAVRAERSVR
jgi:hypothetical protein